MKYVILWFRVFYGAHLLYSSLRHYLTDWSAPVQDVGGRFVSSLVETGLYEVVKAVEGVVGLCLMLNAFVPLVLIVELPISIVIFHLNFFIVGTPRQLFTGPQELFLNGILIVFYFGYYKHMLRPHARPRPVWEAAAQRDSAADPARSGNPAGSS